MLIYLHSAGWERIFSQSPTVPHVAHKIQPSCDEGEGYDLSCYDLITRGVYRVIWTMAVGGAMGTKHFLFHKPWWGNTERKFQK